MVKKIRYYKNFNISSKDKRSILLVGNFDGLHIGHQKLFNLAKKYKKQKKLKIGVVTFEPVPKMYFNKSIKNFRICSLNQKNLIFQNLGIDFVITKKFDKKFSSINSYNFIKNIIYKKLKAKYIFVSNNFKFGNKREGDVKQLIKNEKVFGFKIVKPKPLIIKKKIVSSTYIRNLL
jgi:riboflavin kinase/FMN adenylyltransferase